MFVQEINFATDDPDAMLALASEWGADAMNNGTVKGFHLGADTDNPGQYSWMVMFDSAESAQQNSDRPETAAFSGRFTQLCSDGPTFRNLEIVELP